MKDFFISYNQADRQWAEWIAWNLEEAGFAVILQSWDFRPGSNFTLEMHSAALAAQRTIAVLSPDYLHAPFTLAEWAAAFTQDPTAKQGKLLPVRVRVCDPSGLLQAIVYIDLVGLSEKEARAALLEGVSQARRKPETAPTFPGFRVSSELAAAREPVESDCIRILHISDLQCSSASNEVKRADLLVTLIRDFVAKKVGTSRLHDVIISGDLAVSGKEREYLLVESMLTRLFAELAIEPSSSCFVVPGNHDVDWSSIGPADDLIIEGLESEEDIARVLAHPPTMELLSARLRGFYDFTGRMLGRTRAWRRDRPWRVDLLRRANQDIAIIQLNSAWTLGPKRSRPVVGDFQIREALTETEGADIRIWLSHHELVPSGSQGESRISELIAQESGVDIFCSGHLHYAVGDMEATDEPSLFELGADPLVLRGSNPVCSLLYIYPNTQGVDVQFFDLGSRGRWWRPYGSFPIQWKSRLNGGSLQHDLHNVQPARLQPHETSNAKAGASIGASSVAIDPVSEDHLRDLLTDQRPILILTAVATELKAVLSLTKPLPGEGAILRGHVGQETYYVGMYGAETAIITMCGMGSIGRDAVILATQQAVSTFNPIAIIMIGIAFGKDPAKQDLGDVLVASQVVSYEQQRIGETQTVHRGTIAQTGPVLLNRFRQVLDWSFLDGKGRAVKISFGPVLSGEKLIAKKLYRDELFSAFPQAIGGEMEGAGLYAVATRTGKEWILVKGICDWADGDKSDGSQPLAAQAAASLVHYVLSDATALEALKT